MPGRLVVHGCFHDLGALLVGVLYMGILLLGVFLLALGVLDPASTHRNPPRFGGRTFLNSRNKNHLSKPRNRRERASQAGGQSRGHGSSGRLRKAFERTAWGLVEGRLRDTS